MLSCWGIPSCDESVSSLTVVKQKTVIVPPKDDKFVGRGVQIMLLVKGLPSQLPEINQDFSNSCNLVNC